MTNLEKIFFDNAVEDSENVVRVTVKVKDLVANLEKIHCFNGEKLVDKEANTNSKVVLSPMGMGKMFRHDTRKFVNTDVIGNDSVVDRAIEYARVNVYNMLINGNVCKEGGYDLRADMYDDGKCYFSYESAVTMYVIYQFVKGYGWLLKNNTEDICKTMTMLCNTGIDVDKIMNTELTFYIRNTRFGLADANKIEEHITCERKEFAKFLKNIANKAA